MRKLAIALIPLLILSFVVGGIACGDGENGTPTAPLAPTGGGISWNEAKYHIGERTTVCGPVVDATWARGSRGQPTFLNMGKKYPDSDRFTMVIWIQNRPNFPSSPESYYYGKTVCVTGLITEYQGIAQIEVSTSPQIQVQ